MHDLKKSETIKIAVGMILLGLISLQFVSQIGLSTGYASAVQQSIVTMQTEEERSKYREEMKVIIGCPNQVDVNDSITVYAAGIRDAKATYIVPRVVTMTLTYTEESASLVGVSKDFIMAKHVGYLMENGRWITSINGSVERIADGYIFKTVFPALQQKISVKLTVEMEWISPWKEVLVSKGEKVIYSGEWRDFEKLLATESDQVAADFDAMNIQELQFKNETHYFEDQISNLETVLDEINELMTLAPDPSILHFYLLNISTIVDTRNGSGSYVDKLRTTNPDKYNYYITRLREVNHAFVESLKYLDRKGIDYKITYVNYTYEDSVYERTFDYVKKLQNSTFYNYSYFFDTPDAWGRYGPTDADWDDEHEIDCSWEYLLEGQAWSGHPYLYHSDKITEIDGLSSNTWYNINNAPAGYKADGRNGFYFFNIKPIYYEYTGAIQPINYADHVEIYQGYVYGTGYNKYNLTELFNLPHGNSDLDEEPYLTEFTNFVNTLVDDGFKIIGFTNSSDNAFFVASRNFDVNVSSDHHHFMFTEDISKYNLTTTMTVETPGGYRKPDRAIIVNLMDDMLPLMNRIYAVPRALDQSMLTQVRYPDGSVGVHPRYNASYGGPTKPSQYYLPPDDPNYIPPPIMRLYLDKDYDGWISDARDVDERVVGPYDDDDNTNDVGFIDETGHFVQAWDPTRMTFNLLDYIYRMEGLTQNSPFFINPLSKPFGGFVCGHNMTGADSYDFAYTEYNLTQLFNSSIDGVDLTKGNITATFFAVIDSILHISADRLGGEVVPEPSRTKEWYYKNDYGKWIEAFWNGTIHLGAPVGSGSEDYVAAHKDSYTFTWYDNSLVRDVDSLQFSDFQVSPFTGPDRWSPVGAIISGSMIVIQNSLANLTEGFGYSYGLMYFVYYRLYITAKSLYHNMIVSLSNQVKVLEERVDEDPSIQEIINKKNRGITEYQLDYDYLDEVWDDLDLVTLDKLIYKIITAYKDPNNEYTSLNGKSWVGHYCTEARSSAHRMRELLEDMSYQGKEWDREAQKLPDDFQDLGLIEDIIRWIDDKVLPLLDRIEIQVEDFLNRAAETFQNITSRIQDFVNVTADKVNTWINITGNALTRFINRTGQAIKNASMNLGDKIFNVFGNIAKKLDITFSFAIGFAGAAVTKWLVDAGDWKVWKVAAALAAAGVTAALIANVMLEGNLSSTHFLHTEDAQTVKQFLNDLGEKIGDLALDVSNALQTAVQGVKAGMMTAVNSVSKAVRTAIGAISSAFRVLNDVIITIWRSLIKSIELVVSQIRLILSAINAAIDKLNQVFQRVIRVLNDVFKKIIDIVKKIGSIIVDLIGKSFHYVLDLAGNIFTQVRDNLERALLENKAFVKVADTLGEQLAKIRKNAGVLQYATEQDKMTQEIMLKWSDVLQPAAIIQSADSGFYVYQMGDEFAEKLYFIIEYKGKLVSPSDLTLVVQRFADLEEEFGDNGTAVLETDIPLKPLVDNSTGIPMEVPGIYYAEFFQGKEFDWFKENKNGTGVPDYTAPAPAGWYLTVVNATYNAPDVPVPLNAIWSEKTYLFDKRYILDAFPRIELTNIKDDPYKPIEAIAGGQPLYLEVRILNEMWSQPNVTLSVIVSTDGGIPITVSEYPKIQLNTEDEGPITKVLKWYVPRNAPSGEYDMIISVREYNGDFTAIIARVKIEQSNAFINLIYKWQFWVGTASVIIGIIGVILFIYKKRIKGITLEQFEKKSEEMELERQAIRNLTKKKRTSEISSAIGGIDPSILGSVDVTNVTNGKILDNCTLDLAMEGECGIPKDALKDLDIDKKDWYCNPDDVCFYQ